MGWKRIGWYGRIFSYRNSLSTNTWVLPQKESKDINAILQDTYKKAILTLEELKKDAHNKIGMFVEYDILQLT